MNSPDDRSATAAALRCKAEALALAQESASPADLAALPPDATWGMLHELRVHQIQLELQNEELRRTQEELEAAKAGYFDLYEMAPVGYCTLNADGVILEANLTLSTLLGVVRRELVNRPLARFLCRDDHDSLYLLRKILLANGEPQRGELRMVRPGGTIFWARLEGLLVTGADAAPQCRLAISDISQRKQAEEALRASEQRLRFLVQNSSDSLVIVNPDGVLRYLSPAMEKITGFPLAALEGRAFATFIHPDDMDAVRAAWNEALAHPEKTVTLHFRHAHTTRGWICLEAIAQSFLAEPSLNGVIASVRDISERQALEQTVRRQQLDLEAIFNATNESIHLVDAQGGVLMANESTARRLGTTVEELVGRSVFDFFPDEVAARRKACLQQVAASGQPLTMHDQRDGHSFESSLWPIPDAGGAVHRIAIFCKEVTERVAAEQAFTHSQNLLNATQQLTRVGGWEWDVDAQHMTWTDETYRIHGLTPADQPTDAADHIRRSLACYPPEDRAVVVAAFERCVASGEPYDLRLRFLTVDGRALWVRTVAAPIWADGQVALVRGTIMDITREVEQEQHLHIFHNIVASTTDAMAYLDQDYRYVVVNNAYERFSGRDREHFIGLTVAEYLGEEVFQEVVKPLFDRCLQGEVINCRRWFDYPTLGRRYVDLSYYPSRDDHNRLTGIIAQARDITDHIEAAEALCASEERFQAIIEACPLAVTLIRNGRFHYVNPSARRMLGWQPDADLAAISIEQTIDPRYHEAMRSRIDLAVTSGQVNPPMELMLIRPDGRRVMTETLSMPIQLPEGPAILVMGTDITALKKREHLVRARLRISEAATTGGMDDLLQLIIDEAEMLSDSRIGFFHFLDDDHQTVSLQTWSTSTLERVCQAEGQGLHYSVDQAGVWIDCIRQRRPVIHNDYAALPHRKGFPAGHAPLVRELLVPIFRGENIVGVFGVGNKEQDYTPEDIELITTLGDLAWDIVQRKRAEEALRASEARFRLLLESLPAVAIQGYDTDGTVLYWNQASEHIYGFTAQEAIGRNLLDLIIPLEMRDEVQQAMRDMAESRTPLPPAELSLQCRDGSRVTVYSSHLLLDGTEGRPQLYCVDIDLTERRQMESTLRERQAYLQSIFRASPVGIGVVIDRIVSDVNMQMCTITGYSEGELLGQNARMLYPTEAEYRWVGEEQYRQISHDGAGTVETRWQRKDGRIIDVLLSSTPIDFADLSQGVTFTALDITERKQAEIHLQEQAAFNRRILDSTAAHIAILDPQGMIVDVNTSWYRFAQENNGTPAEKIGPGTSYFCAWTAQHGDISGAEQAFAGIRQVQRGERESFEIEYPCHSPEENRWFSLRVLPLAGGEGQVLVSHTDVSALKQSEEHLRAALAEKEVLLREVHHRVKNNLAAVIGLLDMQRRMLEDPQGQDILTELAGRIRSMSLIHEKLYRADNLARIDFQQYLQALISHLRTSYGSPRIQCQTEAQGVELPLDFAVPCGMIVNELMTNALKYAFPCGQPAPGKDTSRIQVHLSQEKGVCTLSVADNGVGLPAGFDWSCATTLGMVLVRMLGQHQLGGRYTIDQNNGLCFTLTFSEQRGKR